MLAYFMVKSMERPELMFNLGQLGDDFEILSDRDYAAADSTGALVSYIVVCGRICSERATIIRLGGHYLSSKMQVSFIDKSVKDLFRK
jgi:hypothetical protein